jgi:hypothetical protein
VDRNKRPALTSPWKIGFLVSLLLLTVSIGVGYAITRTFGISWNSLRFGEGSWAFDQAAFIREMTPLVGLVTVMSLIAYFAVTGAVRRYRSYLDSGLDYKNLMKSLKKIEDLEESRLKSLSDYPELKQFLLKIKSRVSEREKTLDEKEASLITRDGQLTAADHFKADAGVLLDAIKRGPGDGFSDDLILTSPEMQEIEQAIRQHVSGGGVPSMASVDGEQLAALKEELIASTDELKATIYDISAEMVASQNGAREIELYLGQVKAASDNATGGGNPAAAADTVALVDRLDQVTAALGGLGEETKGMAINTALQAGAGESGVSELVKLADDVREIAARFGGIAAQYQELGKHVRTAVQSQAAGTAGNAVGETVQTMAGKVAFWVERSMVLSDKLKAFETQLAGTVSSIESRLGVGPAGASYQEVPELSIENNSAQLMPDQDGVTNDFAVADPAMEDFEIRGVAAPAAPATHPVVDTPGLAQASDQFEEIGGTSEDNLFEKMQPVKESDESPLAAPPVDSRAASGEFIQGPVDLSANHVAAASKPNEYEIKPETPPAADVRLEIESHRHEAPPATKPAAAPEPEAIKEAVVNDTVRDREEERVPDLYAIGALDYEPSVHQNV